MKRKKKKTLLKRQEALQATMDKFRGRPFDWETGATCIHMLRFHAKRLGHKLPAIPKLTGPLVAARELKKHGWNNVTEMLDELFEPIPVAAMLPGDISILPGDSGLEGVVLSLGEKVIGWHEESEGMVIMQPIGLLEKAWRV
jgi:hypothetical protein